MCGHRLEQLEAKQISDGSGVTAEGSISQLDPGAPHATAFTRAGQQEAWITARNCGCEDQHFGF